MDTARTIEKVNEASTHPTGIDSGRSSTTGDEEVGDGGFADPADLAATFRQTGALGWTDDKAAARWLALTDPATVNGKR